MLTVLKPVPHTQVLFLIVQNNGSFANKFLSNVDIDKLLIDLNNRRHAHHLFKLFLKRNRLSEHKIILPIFEAFYRDLYNYDLDVDQFIDNGMVGATIIDGELLLLYREVKDRDTDTHEERRLDYVSARAPRSGFEFGCSVSKNKSTKFLVTRYNKSINKLYGFFNHCHYKNIDDILSSVIIISITNYSKINLKAHKSSDYLIDHIYLNN